MVIAWTTEDKLMLLLSLIDPAKTPNWKGFQVNGLQHFEGRSLMACQLEYSNLVHLLKITDIRNARCSKDEERR